MVKGLQANWGPCSQTISLDHFPLALACWKGIVAAGFDSGNIIVLSPVTQVHMSVLSKHTSLVKSLAFSSDGTYLVSGSNDKTTKLWDILTGGVIKTFCGHTSRVCSVSISLDCTTIASGSEDESIRLWDVWTGECHHIIRGHNVAITSIIFSPTNPQLLVSASSNHTVQQWNINGYRIGPTFEGDNVASYLDGTCFISWRGKIATVRNSGSGGVVAELQAPRTYLEHCCFSSNGKFMAGTVDHTIYVWDITNSDPHPIKTFVGHTDYITSLTFSSSLTSFPSLVSSSQDRSIKFWQVGPTSTDSVSTDPMSPLTSASIMSVSLQANNGIAISCDSAGIIKIWDISTGHCKTSFHTPAKEIEWGEAELVDGRLIFGWCSGTKIHLWDTKKGELLQTVDVKSHFLVMDLRISGSGPTVYLLDDKSIRAWYIQTGGVAGEVRLEGKPLFNSLVVDGPRVWVRFKDLQIQGWDFGFTGSIPVPLSGSSLLPVPRSHLDFIDCTGVWNTESSRVKNMITGEEVFRLIGKYGKPIVAQWDGQYLIAGYDSGAVLVLDLNHMIPQ